jgi:hypothetical protein
MHILNSSCQETTERARYGSRRKKYGSTDTKLVAFVPTGKIVVNAREEASLG